MCWKFQTGKKREVGVGRVSRFPFKEKRPEAHCDPRARGGRCRHRVGKTGVVDSAKGKAVFTFGVACLPFPFSKSRESHGGAGGASWRVRACPAALTLPRPAPSSAPHPCPPGLGPRLLLRKSPSQGASAGPGSEKGFLP